MGADLLVISLLVTMSHLVRLDSMPILGEEGRRARSAINMIETGDWIVVRNQGVVFPDRPPMSNWLMALSGLVRGDLDLVAIRLPSVMAILATAFLLYGYGRRLGSGLDPLIAPAIYVTFGQVLQLGRLGESEAAFVLFVAASLLLWHLGYAIGWSPTLSWSLGYALAALGALTKGLQAPVYFVGVTTVFLSRRREWRWLFGRGHWIGLGLFLAILLAWQIPYYLATDWSSVVGTWFAVVSPRLRPSALLTHVGVFPLEVLVSLLPWSLILLLVSSPTIRGGLRAANPPALGSPVTFLLVSVAVTFPTVWLSAGAKSRYYMPLYPLIALLVAMMLAHRAGGAGDSRRALLRQRLLAAITVLILLLLSLVGVALVVDWPPIRDFRPTAGWAVGIFIAGLAQAGVALWSRFAPSPRSITAAVLSAAFFLALFYNGSLLTQQIERRQDIGPAVAELRSRVPRPDRMISLGPIHTNFLYFWGDSIPEVPWPRTVHELPPQTEYFSFDRRPSDTAESRLATRGMVVWSTPSTLPFQWLEIGSVDCGRKAQEPPSIEVVVGRVVRDSNGELVPSAP